ncbi:MAG: 50S ribosomal protein L30 [Oligoflexales bacterium]
MSQIRVKLKRSTIGQPKSQRLVVRGLGLRKTGSTNVVTDNNCTRGMVNKVSHLVEYELLGK